MHSPLNRSRSADWPALTGSAMEASNTTLHLMTQVVGKIRLVQTPWVNHSWHVPLYFTARGMTTSLIPHDGRAFELAFDFFDHHLVVQTTDDQRREIPLPEQSVADFYGDVMAALSELGLPVEIYTTPSEIADATPLDRDSEHHHYDRDSAQRLWRALVQMERVFQEFRARFSGKCSPTHFFWGSFDLALTRFSGREAPPHPAGIPNFPDWVAREAYSHEVSSAGFWPGGGGVEPIFYSYAYPTPEGFADAVVEPDAASYSKDLGEFVLPYEAVRTAANPDETLLAFLQSTYEAAADLAQWDRSAFERKLTPSE